MAARALALRRPAATTVAPPIVHDVLRSPGRPLEPGVREEMEQCFHHDFSRVRIHTDARAVESARAVDAIAYAAGRHLIFAGGYYNPSTRGGRRLLAHELTHVAQTGITDSPSVLALDSRSDPAEREAQAVGSAAAEGRSVSVSPGSPKVLRRQQPAPESPFADDPSFLVCLALCEIGLPPSIWRMVVRSFLDAVWAEYSGRYDQARATAEFNDFRTAFRAYSVINVAKAVLGFIVNGRIASVPIRIAAAQAVRTRLTQMLIARGATMAGIEAAEQIVRRVALVIELAIAAGCLTYCGGTSYARLVTELASEAVTGIAEAVSALGTITSGISSAIGGAVSRALLIARATVDPTNWDLTALPAGVARNDARALGVFLWSHVATASADTFVQTVARPLSSFPIPRPLIDALAAELSRVVQSRTGQPTTITPEMLLALSVLSFAQFLHDRRIMTFRREPEQIANETLVAAGQ